MAKKNACVPTSFHFPHTVIVPVACHRKWPDPVLPSVHHHSGYVPALLYPADGFPNDPNLRPANIDRQIYKTIAESLRNKDCTPNAYHLKSKGEVQAAAHVRELSPTDSKVWFEENLRPLVEDDDLCEDFKKMYVLLEVTYNEGQGILDGGHTDSIWNDDDNRAEILASYEANGDESTEPNKNHLPVEWVTGVADDLMAEIVGGRNTAMQVQTKTLANHQQKFDWIKNLLQDEPYADKIAYRENELRSEKPIDIRELLALLAPFNRDLYSLEGEAEKMLPVSAFSQKKVMLDAYIDDMEDEEDGKSKKGKKTYRKLKKIIKDILALHDIIHLESAECYNEAKKTKGELGKGGRFSFVDYRANPKNKQGRSMKARLHDLWFTWESKNGELKPKESSYRLADGALYPMLAAFSALVTKDADGDFVWITPDGFSGVKKLWRSDFASQFMELTGNLSIQVGRNPAQIGKNTNHWQQLYKEVDNKWLKMQLENLKRA